jgi:hypothetical protein
MTSRMMISPELCTQLLSKVGITSRFDHSEERALKTSDVVAQSGFCTFPTPRDNSALSVLGLRRMLGVDPSSPPSFHNHPWYLDEAFGETTCAPGWHSIEMDVTADSIGHPVYYAERLRERGLYLPSAVEVLLMLMLQFADSGERLLNRRHTWTHDRTSEGRFVTIGAFGKNGVFVSSHEVGYQSKGLGICGKGSSLRGPKT